MSQHSKPGSADGKRSVHSVRSTKSRDAPDINNVQSLAKDVEKEMGKNKKSEDFQKMLHDSVVEIEKAVTVSDMKNVKFIILHLLGWVGIYYIQ